MVRLSRCLSIAIGLALLTTVLAGSLAPPAASANDVWVMSHRPTELWSGPNNSAVSFGPLWTWSYLKVLGSEGNRLFVLNPRTNGAAWVDAAAVGPASAPPAGYLDSPSVIANLNLPGRIVGRSSLYAEPYADSRLQLRSLGHNTTAFVTDRVVNDAGAVWYRLDTDEYISTDDVRLPRAPAVNYAGKWIDADLNDPTIVTAYEDGRAVYSALAIKGVATWETPVGTFAIQRRVPNEIMRSDGLGIPRNAPGGYYLENVLYTQYFTSGGAAIHYNYWSSNWGYAGSHGCLGMNYDDSLWFWNWATVGTPIVIHY